MKVSAGFDGLELRMRSDEGLDAIFCISLSFSREEVAEGKEKIVLNRIREFVEKELDKQIEG
jgi:hypothetical protein